MQYILMLSTFALLAGALVELVMKSRRATESVAVLSIGVSGGLILLASLSSGLFAANSGSYIEQYSWQPLGNAGFDLDGLSLTFSLVILLLSLVVALYSGAYMKQRFQELGRERWPAYYFLLLTFVFGMLGTVLATNLVEFYIFFELMLIPSFFLISEFGHVNRDRAALSYFLWTHVGALVMLAGLIVMALSFNTLDIRAITLATHGIITGSVTIPSAATVTLIGVAVVVGLMVKMGGFGLHVWLPGAYKEAPASVSALLSGAMSGIAGYAIIRLVVLALPVAFRVIAPWLLVWGIISLTYGAAVALAQKDVKLLLAYSSISQMGYFAIGIGSFTAFGLAGGVSLYAANGFAKGILFMMAGALPASAGTDIMDRLGGLAGKLPGLTVASLVGFLTMIGVPPTLGFVSEFFVFQGAFSSALTYGYSPLVPLVAIITSVLTSGYSLWAVKKIFYGQPTQGEQVRNVEHGLLYPMVVLCIFTVVLGILPVLFSGSLSFFNSQLAMGTRITNAGGT